MFVPTFSNSQFTDKNGNLTTTWLYVLSQLFNQMHGALSDNGFQVPNKTTAEIAEIFTNAPNGRLLQDKDTDELKVSINGVPKVVQVV